MKKVLPLAAAFSLLAILCSTLTTARAQGTAFTYQGRLNDGGAVASGNYDLKFSLFGTNTTGTMVAGPLTNAPTAVSNGLFTVLLDFGGTPFDGSDRWLEIAVRTNGSVAAYSTLAPRQPVTPAPYAIRAGNISGLRVGGSINNPNLIGGSISNRVGVGVVGATIGGGGFTNGENRVTDSYGTVGGGFNNQAGNNNGNSFATVAGGYLNLASGADSSVLGGYQNQALADWSAVGGGFINVANASYATVAGGNQNHANGNYSAIGGGYQNVANYDFDVIAGGHNNYAGSDRATVAGGENNQANAILSTVGGGQANIINGTAGTIAGGQLNTVNSGWGAIGGGSQNSASAYATVPGGDNNAATGANSFAAGHRAKANHTGAFVWADSSNADFTSTANDQFLIRAGGNVGINTNNPQSALHVNGTVTATAFVGNGAGLTGLTGGGGSSGWNTNGNAGTTAGLNFIGTTDNQPLELKVNNQRALRLEPGTNGAPNIIGGSQVNFVAAGVAGSTIAGGGTTNLFGIPGTNSIAGNYDTIGGGYRNTIQDGAYSTISGGGGNTIQSNTYGASISAGEANTIQAAAHLSTIGGGYLNTISGGNYGTVPGGLLNAAGGNYAFAAGYRAKATNDGAFVWADSTDADFNSTAGNQFLIRATGGVGIGKNNPTTALDVNGVVNATDFYKNGSPFGPSPWINSGSSIYYNGGNVGIGTTSPAQPLHVSAAQGAARLESTGSANGSVFEMWNSTPSSTYLGAFNFINGATLTAEGQLGYLTGAGFTFSAGGAQRMRITSAGKVGIGTSSPSAALHVANGGLAVTGASGPYAGSQGIFMEGTNGNGYLFAYDYIGNGPMPLLLNSPGGRVGIGTLNPSTVLHVATPGDCEIALQSRDSGGRTWTVQSSGTTGSSLDHTFQIIDRTANVSRLAIAVDGTVSVGVLQINGADLAEPFEMSTKDIPKGSVVIIDEETPGQLKLSNRAYDKRVAGILSGANGVNPGIRLKQDGFNAGGQDVALSGRVYAFADASNGAIKPGDLLTTSATPGHCMKATDSTKVQGAIIGKAMSSLENGKGMVLVLVSLQ